MDIQNKSVKKTKKLHIACSGSDYIEHCYMLPSRWIDLLEYDIIGDKFCANFQNACCTPIEFFDGENLGNWHPRTHGPRNYLQSFYLAALIHKCKKEKQYPYAEIRNFIGNKRTRSFQKENDNNETSLHDALPIYSTL